MSCQICVSEVSLKLIQESHSSYQLCSSDSAASCWAHMSLCRSCYQRAHDWLIATVFEVEMLMTGPGSVLVPAVCARSQSQSPDTRRGCWRWMRLGAQSDPGPSLEETKVPAHNRFESLICNSSSGLELSMNFFSVQQQVWICALPLGRILSLHGVFSTLAL